LLVTQFLVWLVRFLVGAYPRWIGTVPSATQRIYFSNHTSHADTIVVWSAMPDDIRSRIRPIAAKDYWNKSPLRRNIVLNGLNGVLIDRLKEQDADPLEPLREALKNGDSLIMFPEGTRKAQPLPSPFKRGIAKLANEFPDVELVPVYCENLHRIMPKGTFFPVPLACNVRFGTPIKKGVTETDDDFLVRARNAVIDLAHDDDTLAYNREAVPGGGMAKPSDSGGGK
jgi:1-acyl-sn-glycerol-3-phosphate acyltransferase